MSNQLVINVEDEKTLTSKIESKEITQYVKVRFLCTECGKDSVKGGKALIRRPKLTCISCSNKASSRAFQSNEEAKRRRLESFKQTCLKKGMFVKGLSEPKDKPVKEKPIKKEHIKKSKEEINKKREETNLKRYGVKNPGGFRKKRSQEEQKRITEKINQTKLEKYGKSGYCNPEKVAQTKLERYGSQTYNNQKGSKRKYLFDGLYFDSSWEVAYYIFLKDKHIDFEFHPDVSYNYEFDGKIHTYHPDFRIERDFIEIKGPHFFENEKMINPYNRKQDSLYESKHQCMLQNNIKILSTKDIKPYILYVIRTYGKAFLMKCRTH